MNKEFFVESKYVDFFINYLNIVHQKRYLHELKNSSLSNNCFSTLNLLEYPQDKTFYKTIIELQIKCEFELNKKLMYNYLHMVDYSNGGIMRPHKHEHSEDYSYILYLNTCDDGETVLEYGDKIANITPIRNKILLFSSNILHKSNYSNSKKILVGGLKIKEN